MANWFYYDSNANKLGPINNAQLKILAANGTITPETILETEEGKQGRAGKVNGLTFAQPSVPSPQQFQSSVQMPPAPQPYPPQAPYPQQPYAGQPAYPPYQQNPQYGNPPPNAASLFCSACGNAVVPTAVVCPKCGSPIRGANHRGASPFAGVSENYFDANALGIGFSDILQKKYAMMKGRARRQEFWQFALIQCLVVLLPMLLGFVFIATGGGEGGAATGLGLIFIFVGGIISLAMMIPSICLQVRRLHDIGWSGWAWFLNLIPYIGGLIVLVLMCLDGQRGDNQYGPNPKGVY